jgi:hypothetical protein
MHAAPANSTMLISQVSLFCFELSSGQGAVPRCNLCLVALSLFLNRARSGDTLTCRRAATPCHAEARRVHRVAVGRADCSRLLSHRCSRALRWSLAHGNGQRHVSLNSLPRCGACNVCAWSLNRAHRSGAGHALARTLVRAAILTAGAHNRQASNGQMCECRQKCEQNSGSDPQRYRRANLRPDMETVASN